MLRMRRVRRDAHNDARRVREHGVGLRGDDEPQQYRTLHVWIVDILHPELHATHSLVHPERDDGMVHAKRKRANMCARDECDVVNHNSAVERELPAAEHDHSSANDFYGVLDGVC